MNESNERLKILLDTLIQLAKLWKEVPTGQSAHSVYAQIYFVRTLIRKEMKCAGSAKT
jgi:hypothetical protein